MRTSDSEIAAANPKRYWIGLLLLAGDFGNGIIGFDVVSKRLDVALVKSEKSFLAADAKIAASSGAHEEICETWMVELASLTATMDTRPRYSPSGISASVCFEKRCEEINIESC